MEKRNVYPNQSIRLDQIVIDIGGYADELQLKSLRVSAINEAGETSIYAIEVPSAIGFGETQPVNVPAGMQELTLIARYSNGCQAIEYSQSFRDELATLELKGLNIRWTGEGFLRLFACFTPPQLPIQIR